MSLYENYVMPHLLHLACGNQVVDRQRTKVVPEAWGKVLEIGMGSGLNVRHYNPDKVDLVWGLEPSAGLRRKGRKVVSGVPFEVRWLDSPAEEIPLDDNSADTVVLTYTLCTIPDWYRALEEMHRVVKPGGRLLFSEHGISPDANVRRWQERINPLWCKLAQGCNLNRPIPSLVTAGGFRIEHIERGYLPGTPRLVGFNYWGAAVPR